MNKINNIWEEKKEILLYNREQVAFPVGKNQDSYNITTYHYINGNGETIRTKSEVVKGFENKSLFTGTPSECYNFIKDLVAKIELEEKS